MNDEQIEDLKATIRINRDRIKVLWNRHHDLNDKMRTIEREIRHIEGKNKILAELPAKIQG